MSHTQWRGRQQGSGESAQSRCPARCAARARRVGRSPVYVVWQMSQVNAGIRMSRCIEPQECWETEPYGNHRTHRVHKRAFTTGIYGSEVRERDSVERVRRTT